MSRFGPTDAGPLPDLVASQVESMHAVCAVTASLLLRLDGARPPAEVEGALREVASALGLSEVASDLADTELTALAITLKGRVLEACELTTDPARPAGWRPASRAVIEEQALSSQLLAQIVCDNVVGKLPGLARRLESPDAKLLDVGVGAGGLTETFCRAWPAISVVGIDLWEPALALARQRLERHGHGDRVELRRQDVRDLDERDAYDLVWLPANFIAAGALPPAVRRVLRATRPGGWLMLAGMRGGTPLSKALVKLRVARAGGTSLSAAESESLLLGAGWSETRSLARELPATFSLTAACRPYTVL